MTDREVIAKVTGTFLGKPKTQRAKPHRCLGCGKVTKHVFCPATYEVCRAAYKEDLRKPFCDVGLELHARRRMAEYDAIPAEMKSARARLARDMMQNTGMTIRELRKALGA